VAQRRLAGKDYPPRAAGDRRPTAAERRVGGRWKLAKREIILDQNVLRAKNLTVFF